MASITDRTPRRALNRAAVRWGYADFDTYIRTGGGLMEAHDLLINERDDIMLALQALLNRIGVPNWNEKLAEAEGEATGEPVAAVQGDEA